MRKLTIGGVAAVVIGGSAQVQDDGAFVTFKVLKPEIAVKTALAGLEARRDAGYQVGVSVVDRFGIQQVFLRDRFAGAPVVETAQRKAWRAVSFRADTTELDQTTRPDSVSAGIRMISQALPVGGGKQVLSGDGSIVAGIGISGAPGPDLDDDCAAADIAAIEEDIAC